VTNALASEPIPNVAAAPAPQCVLIDFKESWATYQARYWLTDLLVDDSTDSVVRSRISYALRRAGIPLSIPAHTVFLTAEDAARAEHVKTKERSQRLEALAGVSLFATLTPEERATLGERLLPAPYAPGEVIVVQGSEVHHLYVLAKGEVEVRVAVEGAPPRAVARLTAPDFFGEMGMLTGERRRATVIALTEVMCWLVEKEMFRGILAARPKIADEISQILAERNVELAAVREDLSEEAKARRMEDEHGSLLEKIQRFFGLE
jgi:CRP-like cAMP-binding protein